MKTVFKLLAFVLLSSTQLVKAQNQKPNVVFIMIDDLRPELGCYGNSIIKTPNLDAFATNAVQFNGAYAQVPVCGASRASIHTGIRPTKNRFTKAASEIDHDTPNAVTLGQHFKQNGYYTVSYGKMIHGYKDAAERTWSEYHPAENMFEYHQPENVAYETQDKSLKKPYKHAAAYEISENTKDDDFLDGRTLTNATQKLTELKDKKQPFFLAVGFARPHLPFVAPKRFWDLYSENDIKEPNNYYLPKNVPQVALSKWGELRAYRGIPKKGNINDSQTRLNLKHGYYASVSFADYLVGKLITKLKKLNLYDNTIIVVIGDHGYQLGEHTMWAKHTDFEIALRVPLLIKTPKMKQGKKQNNIVELVDLFPTLSDLAGLPILNQNQGNSLTDIFKNPNTKTENHNYAFSRWKSGDSVKDKRYRYTEFTNKDGKITAKMLYDHQTDPNENVNIANTPENAKIVQKMHLALLNYKQKYNL